MMIDRRAFISSSAIVALAPPLHFMTVSLPASAAEFDGLVLKIRWVEHTGRRQFH